MSLTIPSFELVFLVAVRTLATLALVPVFGNRAIPNAAKIILAGSIAWLMTGSALEVTEHPSNLSAFLLEVIIETVLGLLLGFATSLALWAITMAGDIVSLQMGFGFGGTIHYSLEQSSGAVSQFYTILATLIFLGIGGHRMILQALSNTLTIAPPYAIVFGSLQVERLIHLAGATFTAALQIALPIVGTMLLADAVLAFLTRVLPQMNAFVFGMPLKIVAGFLVLVMSLPILGQVVSRWLTQSAFNMLTVLK